MHRVSIRAQDALYGAVIAGGAAIIAIVVVGPVGALIAAIVGAVVTALIRTPGASAAEQRVTAAEQRVTELEADNRRLTDELHDPNRPARELGQLAIRSRYGSPFTDRNRPPGW